MACHPEVQAKARAEIDAVVGPDRLPDFSDEPRIPYLKAVIMEVVRWRPVSVIGLYVPLVFQTKSPDQLF
mgnify:CR=1 FL=1